MLREALINRQIQTINTQFILAVVQEAITDGEGHYTGEYRVIDESSGLVLTCHAVRFGNMKYVYTKGEQVLIAMGVSPTNNTTSCFIIGQVAKEYPDEAKPPSDYALDEGEIGTKNPISDSGVYLYSDGGAELRGRVGGTLSAVSVLLGGVDNLFRLALNVKNFIVNITPDKVANIAVKSWNIVTSTMYKIQSVVIELMAETIRLISHKSIILVSDETVGIVSKIINVHGDDEYIISGHKASINLDDLIDVIAKKVTIKLNDNFEIEARQIHLGGSSYTVIKGEELIQWLNSHTHSYTGGVTGPPVNPVLPTSVLSKVVKLS